MSQADAAGLIVRERDPINLETPSARLQDFVTRSEEFYIRNHFAEPELDKSTWRLRIEGAVEHPGEFTYSQLLSIPPRTQTSLLECAGNGRVFLVPKEEGAQWQVGAVGNAQWTGVPLAAMLERVRVKANAVDVVFEGADHGQITNAPKSPGDIHFSRSLPIAKAKSGDVMLAYMMNGAELSKSHGFPVRVIVPGWYGMASVKWLARLIVTDQPFDGFFQSLHYSHWERLHGIPTLTPVTELQVKSAIMQPSVNGVVPAGVPCRIRGMAWTGDAATITRVEVSLDAGKTWTDGRLTTPPVQFAWRPWEHEWSSPASGTHVLMCRATDSRGRTQPLRRDASRRSYEISHVIGTPVEVR